MWPCPSCRQLSGKVQELSRNVNTLTQILSEVTKLLNTLNVKHQEAMADLKKENASLNRENKELRMKNGELNLKINSLTWKSFRKSGQRSHALIGNSIIRDVAQDNLVDTEVFCKRGARISDIKSAVEQLTPGYETITGGNDCEDEPARPTEAIVKSYGELIDAAKMKCQSVTVSSICPRISSNNEELQNKIVSVNAGLVASCNDKESVTFSDSTPSFRLSDGSINDGYFMSDGVHITRAAVNRLAVKLNLKIKDNKQGVCHFRYPPNPKNSQNTRALKPINKTTLVPTTTRVQAYKTDSWCFNCGEPNHVKDRCRYSQPVQCHQCHQQGHKSKFCAYYNK